MGIQIAGNQTKGFICRSLITVGGVLFAKLHKLSKHLTNAAARASGLDCLQEAIRKRQAHACVKWSHAFFRRGSAGAITQQPSRWSVLLPGSLGVVVTQPFRRPNREICSQL